MIFNGTHERVAASGNKRAEEKDGSYNATIYSILLEGEKARVIGRTYLLTELQAYAFAGNYFEKHTQVITTVNDDLLISSSWGVIKCKCNEKDVGEVNCKRKEAPHKLNLVPTYSKLKFNTPIWASDGQLLAFVINQGGSPHYYIIRIIDLLSRTEATKVKDVPLVVDNIITSIAIEAHAFGHIAVLYVYLYKKGLLAVQISMQHTLKISPTSNQCAVQIAVHGTHQPHQYVNFTFFVRDYNAVNLFVVFGVLETLFAFGVIYALMGSYIKHTKLSKAEILLEEDADHTDNLPPKLPTRSSPINDCVHAQLQKESTDTAKCQRESLLKPTESEAK